MQLEEQLMGLMKCLISKEKNGVQYRAIQMFVVKMIYKHLLSVQIFKY
jgi:hypothetical protein